MVISALFPGKWYNEDPMGKSYQVYGWILFSCAWWTGGGGGGGRDGGTGGGDGVPGGGGVLPLFNAVDLLREMRS